MHGCKANNEFVVKSQHFKLAINNIKVINSMMQSSIVHILNRCGLLLFTLYYEKIIMLNYQYQ